MHVPSADIVQPKIARLGNHGADTPCIDPHRLTMLQRPVDDSIRNARHIEGVRQHDGAFDKAHFVYLFGIRHFAKAIDAMDGAGNLLKEKVSRVRENGSHTRPNRPFARDQLASALDQGGMTNPDTCDIRDGIPLARYKSSDLDS
jgi:hypothetical protein